MLALRFSGSASSPFSLTLGFRSEISCGKNMMWEKLLISWHQARKGKKKENGREQEGRGKGRRKCEFYLGHGQGESFPLQNFIFLPKLNIDQTHPGQSIALSSFYHKLVQPSKTMLQWSLSSLWTPPSYCFTSMNSLAHWSIVDVNAFVSPLYLNRAMKWELSFCHRSLCWEFHIQPISCMV